MVDVTKIVGGREQEEQSGFESWVILELLGHRRLGGYLSEQEMGGDFIPENRRSNTG